MTKNIEENREISAVSARLLVAGVALFVVSGCWFLHFLPVVFSFPTLIVEYLDKGHLKPWQQGQFYSELSVRAGLLVSAFMVLLSLLFFVRRFYFLAVFLPLICVFMFVFPFAYEKDNFSWGLSKWSDPMVQQFKPYIITKKMIIYEYEGRHPEIEIPVFFLQYLLTPTFLIGIWSVCILGQKPVRSLFRIKKFSVPEVVIDSRHYYATLSKSYAELMFLLMLSLLPDTLMNIFEKGQQFRMNPPNIYWNIIFIILWFVGISGFYLRKFYFFSLLVPIVFLTTAGNFFNDMTLQFQALGNVYGVRLIIIAIGSRLILSLLGLWIWWNNFGIHERMKYVR
ncbi:MAG: hypothetical protein LBQ54_02790 [Planctomycetaceae bacterium]|jgi:hypothetical protein|nr:hypothetical protein [Planctomycetaceae bacterium]